ncbi:MAG: hypothetical protein HKN47_18475, partial [Pirellulaceae bacterium]|nr:hypothetical protein [Pirellulaceae bacterium]
MPKETSSDSPLLPVIAGSLIVLVGAILSIAAYVVLNQREDRLIRAQFAIAAEYRMQNLEAAVR